MIATVLTYIKVYKHHLTPQKIRLQLFILTVCLQASYNTPKKILDNRSYLHFDYKHRLRPKKIQQSCLARESCTSS